MNSKIIRILHKSVLLSLLLLAGCAPNHKMEIATWNVQRFPPIIGNSVNRIGDVDAKIVESIIESGVDVIALNEVFSETTQKYFTEHLAAIYPYYVGYIDGTGPRTVVNTAGLAQALAGATTIEYYTEVDPNSDNIETWVLIDGTQRFRVSGGPTITQDSGLMFFSKFPFEAMSPLVSSIPSGDDLIAEANGSNWRGVAFKQFQYCEGSIGSGGGDCSAKKGAGMVRIRHPGQSESRDDDIVYNLVFTHLESSSENPGVNAIIRDMQIDTQSATIESLINEVMEGVPDNQPVIILGDFNIDGAINSPTNPDRAEWVDKFTTPGRLLNDAFDDTWDVQSESRIAAADRDAGITAGFVGGGGVRLDYIALNAPPTTGALNSNLCVQHVIVDEKMYTSEEGHGLSDHKPLRASINLEGPQCNPPRAREIVERDYFGETGTAVIEDRDTQIQHPYGTQWFLVTDPGTYSVSSMSDEIDNDLTTEIYAASNLSVPVSQYRGIETEFIAPLQNGNDERPVLGDTYVVNSGPFYIKTFAPSGETGAYTLLVHKHTATTLEDAIILTPNLAYDNRFQAGDVGDSLNRFFRIDTDGPLTNQPQLLTFTATATDTTTRAISMMLVNEDATARSTLSTSGSIVRSEAIDNFSTFYLVAQPAVGARVEFEWRIQWTTNLSMLVFKRIGESSNNSWLQVLNETGPTNVGEDDDIRINFTADGLQAFSLDQRPNMGNFNIKLIGAKTGTMKRVDPVMPCSIGFLTSLEIELEERDVNPNDIIVGTIVPLVGLEMRKRDVALLEGGAAEYQLTYELLRGAYETTTGAALPAARGPFLAIGEPCQ